MKQYSRRREAIRSIAVGAIVAGIVGITAAVIPAHAEESSAVTVTTAEYDPEAATAPFPELEVTVSQTEDLVAQGVTVSWTGGIKSAFPDSQSGGKNFLQIMQCWGDDATGTGPDRTTCQYGAVLTPGATRDNFRSDGSVAPEDAPYTAPSEGPFVPALTSIPFTSVTGDVVASVVDGRVVQPTVDVNTNEFFTAYSTNEVPWAGSGADGTGSVTFELQTALQAPGLGCGSPTGEGAAATGQSCWLVVIPRGEADKGEQNIINSGLFWDAWKHKLAVKLDFRPLGVNCPIGAAERQLAGSEVVSHAVSSWQPAICSRQGGSIFSMLTNPESDSLTQANLAVDAAPLALSTRSLGDKDTDRLTYAPVALGGVALSFAIDRAPVSRDDIPPDVAARARLPFTSLKLTPRLLAKLLTYSYLDSLPQRADKAHLGYVSAEDPGDNARNITRDPDFLAVNDPEWAYQGLNSVAIADALVPQGRSDAAVAVWNYILADEEARSFLAGEPDEWGMIVNPWYSTDAEKNPAGVGFPLPSDSFAKADPAESPEFNGTPPINIVTWRPYTNDLSQGASLTLRGDGQVLGSWDTNALPPRFTKQARNLPGVQKVIGLTDTPSAARYQVMVAELRNPAGQFVAPTSESLSSAAAAMTRDPEQPQVLVFDPASDAARGAPTAYPLAMPVYAASRTDTTDADARKAYASFIRYAAGDGQAPGEGQGMLPGGYAPIPDSWRAQAASAADLIERGTVTPTPSAQPQQSAPPPASDFTPTGPADGSTPVVAPSTDQPSAVGQVAGSLIGRPTSPDEDLGGFRVVIPASALAGAAAAGVCFFASRRRLL